MADEPKGHVHAMLAQGNLIAAFVAGMRMHKGGPKSPPVSLLTAFLQICIEEGLSVDEYAKRAELPQSTMSRHLLDLGDRNRKMEPGLGLITSRFNRFDHRKREYMLTERGRALRDKLVEYTVAYCSGTGHGPSRDR
jgi:DNA-binding MarR family transcriptional regulator